MFVIAGSTIILASVILFAIIVIMVNRANKRCVNKAGKTIPGPPRLPLLGNTFLFMRKVKAPNLPDVFTSLFDSYPSIYQLRVGPLLMVNINDPDLTKTVLVDHKMMERALAGMLLKKLIGTGLLTARSATWRPRRKIIGRTFNSTFLRNFIDVFDTQSKIMVEKLEVHQDGPEFDMDHYISACMFDIINETAMNVKLGTQTNQDQKFKRDIDSIHVIATKRFVRPWLHPEFFFNVSSLGVQFARCTKAARGFARDVIAKQMEEITHQRLRPKVDAQVEHAKTPSIRRKTLLNLLMDWDSSEVKLQDEDIIDELITISITATETTSATTNMLMLALACYPDVQQKVYEEVTEVCGNGEDDGQTITVDQLNNLVYLERVIKETLRLFPIAGLIPREVMEDVTIGDYYVPKGAVVNILVSALHKNDKFWPDPLRFDPDRFLPEEVEKRHPYAYIPFGAGPRNCIGAKYAIMTIKMICAKVVQRYALEKDYPRNMAETKMKIGIILKACDPVTVRIRKRRGNMVKS